MSKLIPPTVGRQVHFHFASPDVTHISGWIVTPDNTYAATIVLVHSERLVNLSVFDGSGYLYPMQSIPFRQPDDERPLGNWCEWPVHTQAGRVPISPPMGDPPTLNRVAPQCDDPSLIRHPVIGAAQELDNDGTPVALGETGTVSGDGIGEPLPTIPQD